jgi:hypothetical protein
LAHGLCNGTINKALVITPPPTTAVLVPLRDGIAAQLAASASLEAEGGNGDRRLRAARTMQYLDKVMLSTVLDVDGVREVLADLERNAQQNAAPALDPGIPEAKPTAPGPAPEPVTEIQDSQDEDDDDDSYEGNLEEDARTHHRLPRTEENHPIPPANTQQQHNHQQQPDVIVITHFSMLLTRLFTHRSSAAAHALLHHLSSRLRHLSRTLPSSPLILLLNSTSSSSSGAAVSKPSNNDDDTATSVNDAAAASPRRGGNSSSWANKPIDPTLRSIFNPPPPSLSTAGPSSAAATAAATVLSRRNKPSFGLVFSQMLDLHLLCTRVPRTEADADAVFATAATHGGGGGGGGSGGAAPAAVEYATAVEILLDDMGVWESPEARGQEERRWKKRRSREQRWAAVQVRDGLIQNAFGAKKETKVYSNVTLAAGFGGPRV